MFIKEKNLKRKINTLFLKLKIKKGSKIILHSNSAGILQFINKEKSLDLLFNMLMKKIGANGTLIVPTYNYDFTKGKTFDKKKSPSHVGFFSNYLLKKFSLNRSNDPIFSHLIFGKLSRKLIKIESKEVFGKQSIFNQFEKLNFKIVCFCCSPATITFNHFIENKMQVKYRFKKKFTGKISNKNSYNTKSLIYYVGKKNISYTIKDKNILKLVDNTNFIKVNFGKFICYSVDVKFYSRAVQKGIRNNEKFLIQN